MKKNYEHPQKQQVYSWAMHDANRGEGLITMLYLIHLAIVIHRSSRGWDLLPT